MAVLIYFDGAGTYNLEEPIGGALRELTSLGKLISHDEPVVFFMNIDHPWKHGALSFAPIESFGDHQLDENSTLLVSDMSLAASCQGRIRVCAYQWVDYADIPRGVDLVITDTMRGKALYEQQGFETIVFYPPTPLGGMEFTKDPRKILFVGALHGGKRPDLAIQAISNMPDYNLHVIGYEGNPLSNTDIANLQDMEYGDYCRDIAGDNIVWHGALLYSDMIREMQEATAIIIPYCSENEFNSNVALEAIANGCVPVIAEGLTDYLTATHAVLLPNQRDLETDHIASGIHSNATRFDDMRQEGWRLAGEILEYCKGEMLNAILGRKGQNCVHNS